MSGLGSLEGVDILLGNVLASGNWYVTQAFRTSYPKVLVPCLSDSFFSISGYIFSQYDFDGRIVL